MYDMKKVIVNHLKSVVQVNSLTTNCVILQSHLFGLMPKITAVVMVSELGDHDIDIQTFVGVSHMSFGILMNSINIIVVVNGTDGKTMSQDVSIHLLNIVPVQSGAKSGQDKTVEQVKKSGHGSLTITDGILLLGCLTKLAVVKPFDMSLDDKAVSVLTGQGDASLMLPQNVTAVVVTVNDGKSTRLMSADCAWVSDSSMSLEVMFEATLIVPSLSMVLKSNQTTQLAAEYDVFSSQSSGTKAVVKIGIVQTGSLNQINDVRATGPVFVDNLKTVALAATYNANQHGAEVVGLTTCLSTEEVSK